MTKEEIQEIVKQVKDINQKYYQLGWNDGFVAGSTMVNTNMEGVETTETKVASELLNNEPQ